MQVRNICKHGKVNHLMMLFEKNQHERVKIQNKRTKNSV